MSSPDDPQIKAESEENEKRKATEARDIFRRKSNIDYLTRFEEQLNSGRAFFIVPKDSLESGVTEEGLGGLLSDTIINYDVLDTIGNRIYVLSQCNKTPSGFKSSSTDPILYVLSNPSGQELMTITGTFSLCHGFLCGRGVKIFVGGNLIGYVSKHFNSVYMVKDEKAYKHYIINHGAARADQVAVEYLYDNLVAADIAQGVWKGSLKLKTNIVYGIHFDSVARPCAESKALMVGAAIILFHQKYRNSEKGKENCNVTPPTPNRSNQIQPIIEVTKNSSTSTKVEN